MTWADFRAACILLAEERVGTRLRDAQRAEDEAVARSIAGLRLADRRGAR